MTLCKCPKTPLTLFQMSCNAPRAIGIARGAGWCAPPCRYIFDRRGVQTDEVVLRSAAPVLNLEWDKDGEILAVLQKGETFVQLWHLATKNMEARRPAYFPENTRNTTSIAVNHRRHQLKRFD